MSSVIEHKGYGIAVRVNGSLIKDLPDSWEWDPDHATALYEAEICGTWHKVAYSTWRSWTGDRRKNGSKYIGPAFYLGTDRKSRV